VSASLARKSLSQRSTMVLHYEEVRNVFCKSTLHPQLSGKTPTEKALKPANIARTCKVAQYNDYQINTRRAKPRQKLSEQVKVSQSLTRLLQPSQTWTQAQYILSMASLQASSASQFSDRGIQMYSISPKPVTISCR
jgi:hypothetical protein